MYSIVLTDGKIVNINADKVEWNRSERMAFFFRYGNKLVAKINMDNVAGWIQTDYKEKSEDWE